MFFPFLTAHAISDFLSNDTIVVALITLASGAIGAITGLLGSIITSRNTAKAQMQQAIAQETFRARAETYTKVFIAENDVLVSGHNIDALVHTIKILDQTIAAAKVFSSPETTAQLVLFEQQVKDRASGKPVSVDHNGLIIAMQKDLSSFTEPVVRPNKWSKSLRRRQPDKRAQTQMANK